MPVEYTNSLGMKFRLIPPGEFMMGSTKEEIEEALTKVELTDSWQDRMRSEAPQHKVILTKAIFLGINEVTQADYEKVMGTNPSHFAPNGPGKDAAAGMDTTNHPVETVSWNDAAEFCAKLSQQEKLKPFYFRAGETITSLDGIGYRLPSEAEWECACRAGTTTKYWIGNKDEDLVRAGWFGENAGRRTHAVGELRANPYGLCDIHGNAWEMMQDWWGPTYYDQFREQPATDPIGPLSVATMRGFRGGNWHYDVTHCRSSARSDLHPTLQSFDVGFRVSLTVDAVRQALKVTGPAMPSRRKASVTDGSTSSTAKPLTPLPQLAIDFAAKRKAAEWVLKMGGTVVLADEQGQPMGLVEGKLPTMNFVVKSVELVGKDEVTDAGLANLAGLRRLTNLNLSGCKNLTSKGLDVLKTAASLKSLNLASTQIANEALGNVASWPLLEELFIPFCRNVDDDGLRRLGSLPHLRLLDLTHIPITDIGFTHAIQQAPNLETLYAGSNRFELRESLSSLKSHRRLRRLGADHSSLSDAAVEVLRTLSNFSELQTTAGDASELARIKPLVPQLDWLWLSCTRPLNEDGMRTLAAFPKLRELQIHANGPSDEGLQILAETPELKVLALWGEMHHSPQGVMAFRSRRPDVYLYLPSEGKHYPPSSSIPFSVLQRLDETDPLPGWELPEGSPPPLVAPCKPEEATALQQKWAEHLKRPVVEEVASPAGLGMKFALIPPGEFRKIFTRPRDPAIEPDMPVRRFRITKPYALSTTEVTWDQFHQFVEATGYQTESETNGLGGRDRELKPDPKINWRTPG